MATTPPKAPPPAQPQSTSGNRARLFLLYGFGISILLHLLLGPLIHPRPPTNEAEQPDKVTVVKRIPTPPPVTPTPKPTPTPRPTPTPHQTPTPPPQKQTPQPKVQKIKVNTLHTSKNGQGSTHANTLTTGPTTGNAPNGNTLEKGTSAPVVTATVAPPTPPPTAPPTPTPTPAPACAHPNVDPSTVSASTPETPEIARQQGITGQVVVVVSLDAKSNIVSATAQSGPPALKAAAIAATRASKFQTEVRNCIPQAAQYLFNVDFESQ